MKKPIEARGTLVTPDGFPTPLLLEQFRSMAEDDGYVCFRDWGRFTPEEAAYQFAASVNTQTSISWMERTCGPQETEKLLQDELRRLRSKTRVGHRPKKIPTEDDMVLAFVACANIRAPGRNVISAKSLGQALYKAGSRAGRPFGHSAAAIAKKIEVHRKHNACDARYLSRLQKQYCMSMKLVFPLQERDWKWVSGIVADALMPSCREK